MPVLTQDQKDAVWNDGYLLVENAEDAIELSQDHLPSRLTHELVRGEASGRVRCSTYDMQLPEVPKATSFFAQQEGADKY